jgi:predicted RNase H-like nuclease (RuvC/YqgF family)
MCHLRHHPACSALRSVGCAVLQDIQAKVAAQGEESKKVLELNAALAQENALLQARTAELNALLEDSHSKVEKLSGMQRQQLEGLQKKLEEQVCSTAAVVGVGAQ